MSFALYEAEMKRPRGEESVLFKEEFTFLKNLATRTADYLKETLISKMPPILQKFEIKKFRVLPQMDAFVFFRVVENQTVEVGISIDEWGFLNLLNDSFRKLLCLLHISFCRFVTIDLEEGDLHFMRYEAVSHLVAGGAVQLIWS